MAVGVEVSWEILENTPMVIGRYREQALAIGYSGDSIINSVSDTFSMFLGFLLASRVSWKFIVAIAIFFELFTLYMIHDNLTLNVLNLIHPFEFINKWQGR